MSVTKNIPSERILMHVKEWKKEVTRLRQQHKTHLKRTEHALAGLVKTRMATLEKCIADMEGIL